MSKRKIVSFLLLLLPTVSVFIANIIIIENAKGQLPDVTQLTYDKNSETASQSRHSRQKLAEANITSCQTAQRAVPQVKAVK